MRPHSVPMSRCVTVTVTGWSRSCRMTCLVVVLGVTSSAGAQPAPPRPRPADSQAATPEPPPGPDPETRAKLDEQAAALAEANRKLAEQQETIAGVSLELADVWREQAALVTQHQALREAIEAEHKARIDADLATKAAPAVPAVRSAWPSLT